MWLQIWHCNIHVISKDDPKALKLIILKVFAIVLDCINFHYNWIMQEFVIELYLNGFVTVYRSEYLRNDISREVSRGDKFHVFIFYFIFQMSYLHVSLLQE